ncbi:MAG TPA: hypothetical protein VKA69_13235 [Desulfobacteria bacterium]|nr:hypothetical protein [Desulfobacteria bacterium]
MGTRLVKAFGIAKEAGGMKATMRLAMKGGMSSDKAASAPDSPENIQKFEAALKDITGKAVKL